MSTVSQPTEAGRPVEDQQDPGAPETTEAASGPIVPGTVVEIDLFGEGVKAVYAALLVRGSTDAGRGYSLGLASDRPGRAPSCRWHQ